MNIEHELRDALRRKDAPRDLAERVLERIHDSPAAPPRRGASWVAAPRWLAAAAVLTLSVAGGARYYESQQQAAEAKRVREELRVALQITNDALARVQSKITDSGNSR